MKIRVPDEKFTKLVQTIYDLSKPQGMGFLHFTAEPMTDEQAEAIVKSASKSTGSALYLDYVPGRACKMSVHRDDEGLYINGPSWYDHGEHALKELCRRAGLDMPQESAV